MDAVATGNMQQAHQIWKPSESYTMKDFLEDWGDNGYYGPVKSYTVERPEKVPDAPAAAITIETSPYQPYPHGDPVKESKSKKVTVWVQFKDQSISFPPY